MNVRSRINVVVVLVGAGWAALIALGCGEAWQADVYPATGRVVINGQPAVGALVQLVPVDGSRPDERNSRPWGVVQSDGAFTLATYEGRDGAPAGDYAVTLTWPPDVSTPTTADRLRSRYARADQSPWKVTIKEEENVLQPIELTGVKLDEKAGAKGVAGPMTTTPLDPRKTRR